MKLALAAVLTIATQLPADTDPYRGFSVPGNPGQTCCGGNDCRALPDGDARAVRGGYSVIGWGFVPNAEAQPGPDGHYHLCEYPKGVRRCFLFPAGGV